VRAQLATASTAGGLHASLFRRRDLSNTEGGNTGGNTGGGYPMGASDTGWGDAPGTGGGDVSSVPVEETVRAGQK